jgi:hypothetical protein
MKLAVSFSKTNPRDPKVSDEFIVPCVEDTIARYIVAEMKSDG